MRQVIFRMLGLVLAASALMLTTTSCEKDNSISEIPGCKDIICEAGDRPTFSFTVGDSWQLSSDAVWCKFVTPGGELQEMAGVAGSHTITLKITDDGIKNQPTFANITIKIGSNSGIIAKIERGADKLYMKLYDVTDTPKEAIELGYVDWVPFRIEANFRFAAIDIPEWVEIGYKEDGGTIIPSNSITGVPGEQTEGYARIINDGERERFEIKVDDGHKITFSDESGRNTFEFPIIYKGMGTDALTFTGPTEQYYGWEVSLDGQTFRQASSESGQVVTFNGSLDFYITAHENTYKIIRFEQKIERGISSYVAYKEETYGNEDMSWIGIKRDSDDPGLLTITVDPAESMRHGMVMALPTGIYNKKHSDILGNLFEMDSSSGVELPTIKSEYLPYVLMEFTQRDLEAQQANEGMYIYHSLTTLEIAATRSTDNELVEQYGVDEIYTCPFVNSTEGKRPGIIIDPRIEEWTTASYEGGNVSAEVSLNGELLKMSENEYYIGENKDERLALHLWGPSDGAWNDGNAVVVFKVGGTTKKVLIVTPPLK